METCQSDARHVGDGRGFPGHISNLKPVFLDRFTRDARGGPAMIGVGGVGYYLIRAVPRSCVSDFNCR
jgi:hypothetical protein